MLNNVKAGKKRVRILGAGISGLVAGIILSRNNYKVEIFEKKPHIGSFFINDIHSLRNYVHNQDILKIYQRIGIKILHTYPVYNELRFSPSMRKIEIYSKKRPLFYNFFRGYKSKHSFDISLYKIAKENGVKFHFNHTKGSVGMDIVANGSSLAKMIGYGAYYTGISDKDLKPYTNYIFFNNRYSPHGYSYILLFKNIATIVLVSTKIESKNKLKNRFQLLKNNIPIIKEIAEKAKQENEIFGYSYYNVPKSAIKNGKLYIGEAAGFIDAATGFGTHYAIMSGYCAATSIIKNQNYDVLWKKSFGEDLAKQYLKRKRLDKFTNSDYEIVVENMIKKYGNYISFKENRARYNSFGK